MIRRAFLQSLLALFGLSAVRPAASAGTVLSQAYATPMRFVGWRLVEVPWRVPAHWLTPPLRQNVVYYRIRPYRRPTHLASEP
jgi:hypothetical protein